MIFKTKKQQDRYNQICPNNIPKWIRCYDNGGKTADRYTVVFTKKPIFVLANGSKGFGYLGMSSYPFHPQGIGTRGESPNQPIDRPSYGHLGKKILFENLPEDCKKLTITDYLYLWNFTDHEGQKMG